MFMKKAGQLPAILKSVIHLLLLAVVRLKLPILRLSEWLEEPVLVTFKIEKGEVDNVLSDTFSELNRLYESVH